MGQHVYIASCVPDGGIYHFYLDEGKLQFREKTACDRPMYLQIVGDKMQVLLRKPEENAGESALIEYSMDPDGVLWRIEGMISTKGQEACHLCRYEGETYVANYTSGSLFSTNGSFLKLSGVGVNPRRQEGPHMHYIYPSPDQKYLLAVDLGLDSIYCCDANLQIQSVAQVPPGCGPRHLAYSEDGSVVFCVNELGSSVSVFRYESGRLDYVETVSCVNNDSVSNYPAAIRVRERYVYASNRGDDSIACLEWNGEHLELKSVTPCLGKYPRDFLLVQDYVICANEKEGNVTVFRAEGPVLTPVLEPIEIPGALCVVAVPQ